MKIAIIEKGNEYVSASLAAKKLGYTSDYIGQLCRSGKIPGKLMGRTWFVDLQVLVNHKKNRKLGKPKIDKSVVLSKPVSDNHDTAKVKINNIDVLNYVRDNRELLPVLASKRGNHTATSFRVRAGDHVFASLSLIFVIVFSFAILESELPYVAEALRTSVYTLALMEEGMLRLPDSSLASSLLTVSSAESSVPDYTNPLLMSYPELQNTPLYKGYFWIGPSSEMANVPVENPFGK